MNRAEKSYSASEAEMLALIGQQNILGVTSTVRNSSLGQIILL
jgi:hypothetical protein